MINKETLGVDVLAIGVPLMIDAKELGIKLNNIIVTPKEIDIYVRNCAKVLSSAINEVVHTKKYKDYL